MATKSIAQQPGWLNKSRMAASLDISVQAFDKWGVKPVAKIGRETFYDAKSVLDNRLKHQGSKDQPVDDNGEPIDPLIEYKLQQERLRLTKAQADGQELRNRVKERQLVPTDFCTFAITRLCSMLGSALDTIHVKVKRKQPDIEVRFLEAIEREVSVTRNEAAALADTLPELLNEFFTALDEGAD
jgi:phage terminase Nu1 subunit (DNA packaging protein)